MRMRKKKNGEARLRNCAAVLSGLPEAPRQNGAEDFGYVAPVWLEIGCGKGNFACTVAERHPEVCLYALERVGDVLLLAAERAMARRAERPRDNLRFLQERAENLPMHFAPGSLDAIYLNFSDPWPKKGYAKRCLTHRRYLCMYFTLLRENGCLYVKTDNSGFFDFTLEELTAIGLHPEWQTRDLHGTEEAAGNVMTEYEAHFVAQGMQICALRVRRPVGYTPPRIPVGEERAVLGAVKFRKDQDAVSDRATGTPD